MYKQFPLLSIYGREVGEIKEDKLMKIKTWIKFEESFLPPRCRKLRYRECEDYVDVNLKEIAKTDLQLAFEDNSYEGKGEIYHYKGKLWCRVKMPNSSIVRDCAKEGIEINTPLDYLVWCHSNCSSFFYLSWDRERGIDTSRDAVMKRVKKSLKRYLLVDGVLYISVSEPRYVINTFGLGHNHGGTGMFCEYHYNPNISKERYFSALEGEQAVAYANMIAERRGDTKDIGKFKPFIICHMPELVKVKPHKQHGNGNPLLNAFEDIAQNSNSAMEAGILITAMSTANN